MHPTTAHRIAGLHITIDAARLAVAADAIAWGDAGALNAALVALLFEHPAATAGDAAFFIVFKTTGGEGRTNGVSAALIFFIAARTAGAIKAKSLAVGGTSFQVAIVAAQLARFTDLGAAGAEQAVQVARTISVASTTARWRTWGVRGSRTGAKGKEKQCKKTHFGLRLGGA
jgi:hypothetical protein